MDQALVDRLTTIAARYGGSVDHLITAVDRSAQIIEQLRAALVDAFGTDGLDGGDVLAVGSVARGQCTRGSDIDFYAMTEGSLPAETGARIVDVVLGAARAVGLDAPNAQGPLARAVPRAEVETVHAMDDFGRVMRRMTLLTASTSLYRPRVRAAVLARVVDAFVGSPREPRVRGVVDQIVRQLRLSNMVTEVMLHMKTPDGGRVQWTKVQTLYRIEQASCLAATFQAELVCAGRPRETLVEDLVRRFDRSYIWRLLDLYDLLADGDRASVATIFFVADDVIRLLGTAGVRERLAANDGSPECQRLVDEVAPRIEVLEGALFQLFFRTEPLRPLTERLALFG